MKLKTNKFDFIKAIVCIITGAAAGIIINLAELNSGVTYLLILAVSVLVGASLRLIEKLYRSHEKSCSSH